MYMLAYLFLFVIIFIVLPSNESRAKKHLHRHEDLHIFSIVTDVTNPLFQLFNYSAHRSGINLEVLGVNDPLMTETPLTKEDLQDKNMRNKPFHSRSNFGRKIYHLYKACSQIKNKQALVILVDGYDSLFVSESPKELIIAFERARHYAARLRTKFISNIAADLHLTQNNNESGENLNMSPWMKSEYYKLRTRYLSMPDIIAGAEMNCWPEKSLSSQYPHYSIGQKMRFLNSGVIAGTVGALMSFFEAFPFSGREASDQRYWAGAMIASERNLSLPVIDVDYQNHLVASISKVSWKMLSLSEEGRPIVDDLSGSPAILHLPNNKDKMQECFNKIILKKEA